MRYLFAILTLLPCHLLAQSQYATISSVSVDTTSERKVTINWSAEPVSDNQVYAIYHWANLKWVEVVDSLPSAMRTYQDVVAHPFEQPERYAMSTSIQGQSDSPLSDFHQTVFLYSGDYDLCSKKLMLHWNPYKGVAVNSYSVFGRARGEQYAKIGDVTDTVLCTNALSPGATYDFYVNANLQNGCQSHSNIISYNVFNPNLADESLVGIDTLINRQGSIELLCRIDANADLSGYAVQVYDGSDFVNDTTFIDFSSCTYIQYQSVLHSAFRLSALDYCGDVAYSSAQVSPLVVDVEADSRSMNVKWNNSLGDGETYTVCCSVDGATETVAYTGLTEPQCNIEFQEIADDVAQNFCIKVEASLGQQLSVSNVECVERQPDIVVPDAFTPNGDGVNDTFGPVIKSAQIISFEFFVYDRYGGQVYGTTDWAARWDGTYGGRNVAEGGYLYYMKIRLQNGQQIERKGSVNVIYP